MWNGKYKIEILFFANYTAMAHNLANKKITFDNYTRPTINIVGTNIPMGASVECDISAQTMSDYKCILTIHNINPSLIQDLQMTPNEALNNGLQGKYIKLNIFCFDNNDRQIKVFTGQEVLGQPQQTITGNNIKLTLQPSFYLEQKTMQLKIDTTRTTANELKVKQTIADYYNLSLQSYSSNDNKPLVSPVDELITDPIKWLKARYPNENIYATDRNLFCVENGKTINQYMSSIIHNINELNGLKYITKIMPNVYDCDCFFTPQLSLFDNVKIQPLTNINQNILNGSVKGKITQMKQYFKFSNTTQNQAYTQFRIML